MGFFPTLPTQTAVDAFYDVQVAIRWTEPEATSRAQQRYEAAKKDTPDLSIDQFFQDHSELQDYQTRSFQHSTAIPNGDARTLLGSRADDHAGIAFLIRADGRFQQADPKRMMFRLSDPAGAGGDGGGIEALDPNFKSGSVWSPISTEQVAFSVYDAVVKGFLPGRRPGRGGYIINHPDRFSTIRVMDHRGRPVFATTDFILEAISRPKRERLNPQITFDEVIARFGQERMKVYSFQGKLLDAANFDWMRQWDEYWEKFMRGEVLAKNLWRAYVLYKAKIIGGYMISTTINENASGPVVPFGFTMLITDDENIPRLNLITSDDEQLLREQYDGTEEQFNAELRNLRFDMEGLPGYLKGINAMGPNETRDPLESTVINEDLIAEMEAEEDAE